MYSSDMSPLRAVLVIAVALTVALVAARAEAGAPTDQLKQYMEQVIKVLDDPTLQTEPKKAERRAAVRKVAIEIFDVGETARRALGRHWKERTPAEQKEFVDLFADLLERTYISRIDLYGGERVRFTSEQIDGENAVVRSRIV